MEVKNILARSAGRKHLPVILLQTLGNTFPAHTHQAKGVEVGEDNLDPQHLLLLQRRWEIAGRAEDDPEELSIS